MNKFLPSPQQAAFFQWVSDEQGSCVLEAVAGSGKTTTLIEALQLMDGSVFFGAYNRKIAEEIKSRVTTRPEQRVATMHAAGFGFWMGAAKDAKLDNNKCRIIYRSMVTDKINSKANDLVAEHGMMIAEARHNAARLDDLAKLETPVLKLVSIAKQAAAGVGEKDGKVPYGFWRKAIDHYGVDCLDRDGDVMLLAGDVLSASQALDHKTIDFDDMIYAPLFHKAMIHQYDWVLIDEAQDTNAARRLLALRMLKPDGRLVAVGDRHQAIYGFTGADADALDKIAKAVDAVPMPLTVTYRCPKAVVELARQWVSHIEAHHSAPQGLVEHIDHETSLVDTVVPGDAILCRFNAPLLGHVYAFIAQGIPAKIEGRDIGAGLRQLASRWKVSSYGKLLERIEEYHAREHAKLVKKEEESAAQALTDRVDCLRVIIARVSKIDPTPVSVVRRVCDEIMSLFDNNVAGDVVLLSSIHKSKGREWNNVYWLQAGASPWAKKEWEMQQETNLNYVACTRAKSALYLVEMPPKA
jgi:DNA helicase II / ATP-dependent DNA helicase PcrA